MLDEAIVRAGGGTIDQLSRSRLELVIGKGNELHQLPMLGITIVPAGTGTVAIKSAQTGLYVCAENAGADLPAAG